MKNETKGKNIVQVYKSLLNQLLIENMSHDGYKFFKELSKRIPNVWDKLSSSSRKYHQKENGYVPSIAEHTYEMLFAGTKILKMFGFKLKTKEADLIILALLLHDVFKYGSKGTLNHTISEHDELMANLIHENKKIFNQLFENENMVEILEESVRFHAGRFSTSVKNRKESFDFSKLNSITFFVHMLDMLSSMNLLKIWK